MRICYFLGDISTTGGIERVLSILTSEQVKDPKLDITIVSQFHSFQDPNYSFPDNVKIEYLVDRPFDGAPGSFTRLKHHFETIGKVRKYFKHNSFALILSQAFPNTFTLWLSGIDMSRVVGVEHVYYGYYSTFIRKIRHFVYRKLAHIVVLTNRDNEDFRAEGLENVTTIANPVVLSKRKKSQLEKPVIISVGRLVYQKGFDTLINIFKDIHAKYPEWSVEIYGRGVLQTELQEQIDREGLSNCFRLMGNTDHIEEMYQRSSIFALPSRFEGFPMVLVEAMGQGLPCVSFDCPNGPSDIIYDKSVGILVENQNKEDFKKGLCKLMSDINLRREIGARSYDNVERFDVRNIVSKWKYLYAKVLA